MSSDSTIKHYHLYVDGSCSPNPGLGGWGLILVKDEKLLSTYVGGEKESTNNRMELSALLNGLELCSGHPDKKFTIFTDSQLSVNTYNIWMHNWKMSQSVEDRANSDLVLKLLSIHEKCSHVEVCWIKGHDKNAWNNYSDKVANYARHMILKGIIPAFGERLKIKEMEDFPELKKRR